MKNKTITIVGTGLLGGSYAMGLTQAGNTVYGIDINEESLIYAKEKGYIKDGASSDYAHFLAESDIIVLALYPEALITWIKNNITLINKNALITDVCGVKQFIIKEVQEVCEGHKVEFYASHPMRGKERLGVKNADCAIFKDANFILTPTEKNTEAAKEIIIDMAKTLGFTVIKTLSPEEHDRMIAYLSQLTHVIAVCLMTSNTNPDIAYYSGDSFRDLTRIAKIDEYLWSELFSKNKELLCEEIDIFAQQLQELRNHIKNDDIEGMKEMFRLSSKRRETFDKKY